MLPKQTEVNRSSLAHVRRRNPEVLLYIDAFEELFTLNDELTRTEFSGFRSPGGRSSAAILWRPDRHAHDPLIGRFVHARTHAGGV